jgi:hypothetical protein
MTDFDPAGHFVAAADLGIDRAIEQQCRHRLIAFLANTPGKPRAFLHERGGIAKSTPI